MEFWKHPVESISLSEQQSVRDDSTHHQGSDFVKRDLVHATPTRTTSSPAPPPPLSWLMIPTLLNPEDDFIQNRVSLHRKNYDADSFAVYSLSQWKQNHPEKPPMQ
ncbi:unnamed protein product, partial [Heterotrigona itama]